jgi:hypothetical protein
MNDTHNDSGSWRLIDIAPPVLGGVLYHPLAEAFRLLEGAELDALAADIKVNGLHHPIVLYENEAGRLVILEGRNRHRACLKAEVEPRWRRLVGDAEAAKAFVVSENMKRRHDNEYELAKARRALATITRGGDRRSQNFKLARGQFEKVSMAEAATDHISVTTMARVGRIEEKAHPIIRRAVELEIIKVKTADRYAGMSPEDQQAEVDKWIAKAVRGKEATPEQRERWAQRQKLNPKPKKEIDPVKQSKLMTVINLASWDVREFVWKKLWAMFGPAMRSRLIEEVIGPDRRAQLGFGDDGGGDEARYSGDIAEDRG